MLYGHMISNGICNVNGNYSYWASKSGFHAHPMLSRCCHHCQHTLSSTPYNTSMTRSPGGEKCFEMECKDAKEKTR